MGTPPGVGYAKVGRGGAGYPTLSPTVTLLTSQNWKITYIYFLLDQSDSSICDPRVLVE